MSAPRGLFVTATDTEVGKTVTAAAICARLRAEGAEVRPFKPAVTGEDEPVPGVPTDHALLSECAGVPEAEVTPFRFGPAVSPHLAGSLAGAPVDPAVVRAAFAEVAGKAEVVVCEGVGGLLVPITDRWLVADFAVEVGLPLVLAVRPALGTINHTLLTLEAARARGLQVRGVVVTPWPAEPSVMERSNAETIERLGEVEVAFLPRVASLTPAALAEAASALPLERWLG